MSVLIEQIPLALHDDIERRFRSGSAAFQRHFMKVAAKISALYREQFPEDWNAEKKFHGGDSTLKKHFSRYNPKVAVSRGERPCLAGETQTGEDEAFSVASKAEEQYRKGSEYREKGLVRRNLRAAMSREEQPCHTVETQSEENEAFLVASGADERPYRKGSEHLEKRFVRYNLKAAMSREEQPCFVVESQIKENQVFPVAAEAEQQFRRGCGTLQQHSVKIKQAEVLTVTAQTVRRLILSMELLLLLSMELLLLLLLLLQQQQQLLMRPTLHKKS